PLCSRFTFHVSRFTFPCFQAWHALRLYLGSRRDRLLAIRGAYECGSVVWRRNFFHFRGRRRAFFVRNEGIARPEECALFLRSHRASIGHALLSLAIGLRYGGAASSAG